MNTAKTALNRTAFEAPKLNWNNPDTSLLEGRSADRPSFPTTTLGSFWGPWVEALAKSKNTPVDYVGAGLLTTAAALIGNARTANGPAWSEPPIIWTALVGHSSAGKSPAMDPFVDIIGAIEAEVAADLDDDSPSDGTIHIDDVTAQAAAEVAAFSDKGLILTKDELSHWWTGLGRNEGFWNKAYGGRLEKVKRKNKPTIVIKRLAINILGGAQPSTLTRIVMSPENKGFAARWLYVFPKPVEGYRSAPPVDLQIAGAKLRRLWNLSPNGQIPVAVPLTSQAAPKFEQWVDGKRRAASADEDGVWGQWLGKQGGACLRLALVFECLWWAASTDGDASAGPTKISAPAITAAMAFIDSYAAPMAALTLNDAARPVEEQDAVRLLRMLASKGDAAFNARLLARSTSHGPAGRLANPDALKNACAVLAAAKLIRHVGERSDGKPGRAPSNYEVNPAVLSTAAQPKATRRRAAR